MNKKTKKFLKEKIWIAIISLAFTAYLAIKTANTNNLYWDSAVYVEIGKYIFSAGNSGIWEPARPLVWPLILGLAWKTGINPITAGKIMTYLSSLIILLLTYLLAKETFDKKTGIYAAALIAATPTFILANTQLMTEIPSTLLSLAAVYALIKKRYILSGILFGTASMTRFLQLFIFGTSMIYLIYLYIKKQEKLKNILAITTGFMIPVMPYLALNIITYKDILYPFMMQAYLAKYTGWFWWQPAHFYLINIIKENFLAIFLLPAAYIILKQKKKQQSLILIISLVYLIYYTYITHKEMRFLITLLPYMYIAAAYGINKTTEKINNKNMKKATLITLSSILLISSAIQARPDTQKEDHSLYYTYLNSNITGDIYTTSPLYLLETNRKAEMIYYPTFDTAQARKMQTEILKAEHVLLNPCDIQCPPWEQECIDEREKFIQAVKENFKQIHHKKQGYCDQYIFTSER